LENGKDSWDEYLAQSRQQQYRQPAQQQQQQQMTPDQIIASMTNLNEREREWLNKHKHCHKLA
jgi:hypothetical protein